MGAHVRTVVIRICSWRLGVLPEELLEVHRGSRGAGGKSQSSRKVAEEALGSRGEAVELDKRERQRKALLGSCGQLQAGLVASWRCAGFPNTSNSRPSMAERS